MTVTLSDLRTRARRRANMERSQFVSDAELTQYVNDSYLDLYDILVTKFNDYYVADPLEFTIASGSYEQALPADFYKLLGLDRKINGNDWFPLNPFNWKARNVRRISNRRQGVGPIVEYRILGGNLRFVPEDQAPGDYRLWYVPRGTTMTDDDDTVDGVNGWEEYIVIDAAIKCLVKEESDTTALRADKAALKLRIDEAALNRDVGEVETIQDVRGELYFDDPLFY